MSISYGMTLKVLSQQRGVSMNPSGTYAYPKTRTKKRVQQVDLDGLGSITRVKEMVHKVELSVSSYDTAWVAMVPTGDSLVKQSHFPECIEWILENQNPDGSWAAHPNDPLLVKDSLSSTLACIMALRKWDVGQQLVNRGLDFISSNQWAATDDNQRSPIGFDIIFPGMIEQAQHMGLSLPLNTSSLRAMLNKRDSDVQSVLRSGLEEKKKHLAYVAEGWSKSDDWKDIMKYQRSNGSLFNSPSTTAAALLHLNDDKCFKYLNSLLQRYENAVPTIYPLDIYTRLCTVDNLRKLGIDQYFKSDIKRILDEIYICWLQGDDEIFSDVACLVTGFRLLRMNGYDVSSDVLAGLDDQQQFFDSVSERYNNTDTILELYMVSLIPILQSEPILDKIRLWTRSFLKQGLVTGAFAEEKTRKQVQFALQFTHAELDRLETRKCIEVYDADNIRLLKTSYRCLNMDNKHLLELALTDYNACQYIQQKEIKMLKRWLKEYRLDELKEKYERQTVLYGFFSAASILFSPEHSDARMSWAKLTSLVTLIDDFYDFGGNEEEQLNMIELIENWDRYEKIGFVSEQVEIIFFATYYTINEYAVKGSINHGRSVKDHLVKTWLRLNVCMRKEFEWARDKTIPTLDEYIEVGFVSIGLGPTTLAPTYCTRCNLPQEAMMSDEFETLYKYMSIIARLLNDLQGVEREYEQGKLSSVLLLMAQQGISMEEAKKETEKIIDSYRRELLRMVQQNEGSIVPKEVKDNFWKTTKIVQIFYNGTDGFSSQHEMNGVMDSVLYKPILLPQYSA